MGSRLRIIGSMLTALTTAAFPLADLNGVKIAGREIPWQYLEILSFVIFAALVYWQLWEMSVRLNPQRQMKVTAIGEPGVGDAYSWRRIEYHPDNERIYHVEASVRISLRNRDDRRRMLSDVFVEVFRPRRWWFPVQRLITTIDPNIMDSHAGLIDMQRPRRVNWSPEPEGDEIVHVIDFERWWERGQGPKYVKKWGCGWWPNMAALIDSFAYRSGGCRTSHFREFAISLAWPLTLGI